MAAISGIQGNIIQSNIGQETKMDAEFPVTTHDVDTMEAQQPTIPTQMIARSVAQQEVETKALCVGSFSVTLFLCEWILFFAFFPVAVVLTGFDGIHPGCFGYDRLIRE